MALVTDWVRPQIALSDAAFIASPTWTTFTDTCRSMSWGYARDGITGQAQTSGARFRVLNNDGRWDKSTGEGGSPWANNVDRWRQVRILGSKSGGFSPSVSLWRGFLWDVQFGSDAHVAWADVEAIDLMGVLAEIWIEDEDRDAELSGDRVQAILSASDIPAGYLNVLNDGTVQMEPATISGNALGLIQECARAEGGLAFCGRDGKFNFVDRFYFVEASITPADLDAEHIKDVVTPGSLGADLSVHTAKVSGSTGLVASFGSPPSDEPASSSRSLNLPITYNADAAALAEWLQRHHNYSPTRLDGVELDVWPHSTAASTFVRDGIVDNEIAWLARCTAEFTAAHGITRDDEHWIEAESHEVDYRNDTWRCSLGLSPYETDYHNVAATFWEFGATMSDTLVPGF